MNLCDFHARKTAGAPPSRPCEAPLELETTAMGDTNLPASCTGQ